eukprot:366577-Chlamydomonas_euryale.AAC.25
MSAAAWLSRGSALARYELGCGQSRQHGAVRTQWVHANANEETSLRPRKAAAWSPSSRPSVDACPRAAAAAGVTHPLAGATSSQAMAMASA